MAIFREPVRTWLARLEEELNTLEEAGSGSGDVVGPSSSTDNAVARYDSTTGKLLQNSLVTVNDAGSIALPSSQTVDGRDVSVDGTTLDGHTSTLSSYGSRITTLETGAGLSGSVPLYVPPASPNANDLEFASDGDGAAAEFFDVTNSVTRVPSGAPDRLTSITSGTAVPKTRAPSAGRAGWFQFQVTSASGQFYLVTWTPAVAIPTNCFIWTRCGMDRMLVGTGPSRMQFGLFGATGGHADPANYIVVGGHNASGSPDVGIFSNVAGSPGSIAAGIVVTAFDYCGLYKQGTSYVGYVWNDGCAPITFAAVNAGFTVARWGFRVRAEAAAIGMVDFIRQASSPAAIIGG